jgi:hypothetical protein
MRIIELSRMQPAHPGIVHSVHVHQGCILSALNLVLCAPEGSEHCVQRFAGRVAHVQASP